MLEYHRNLKDPSRALRKNMTDTERLLWSRLRRKQLHGVPFYRQKPIGPYVVDFYAPAAGLVIEVDGSQHYEAEHAQKDAERDRWLAETGLQVLRFHNRQVLLETESVVEEVSMVIQEKMGNPPLPPFVKGGMDCVPVQDLSPSVAKGGSLEDSGGVLPPPLTKGDRGGFFLEHRATPKDTGEFDPVMLSALEHYSYCPRQCALIHVEQTFHENIYTMRGRDVHEHVDVDSSRELAGVRLERALPIWSDRLGLVGKADMVEFHGEVPYPVEYKSGKHRAGRHEALQLCAQAICLEEMFKVAVPEGAIFWHASRERKVVVFTDAQRAQVEEITAAVREMLVNHHVPPPVNDKRCQHCSLKESCLPHVVGEQRASRKAARELFAISDQH